MFLHIGSVIAFLSTGIVYAANNDSTNASANTSSGIQRDFPGMLAYQRQLGHYGPIPFGGNGGYSGGNIPYGAGGGLGDENVNFDFQCKCTSRSSIFKNMQAPLDANQAAQQQIQQLQEQVRRLQQQIQRSSSGKSSFEQFAQMLAQADGLECNCSGASIPASYPSHSYGRGSGPMSALTPFGGGSFGVPIGGSSFNPGQFLPPTPFGYGPMKTA